MKYPFHVGSLPAVIGYSKRWRRSAYVDAVGWDGTRVTHYRVVLSLYCTRQGAGIVP